jgi:lipoic acid synthetase
MIQEKKKITIADIMALKKDFRTKGLNTVCQSDKCPNIGECFKNKTATFLILGKNCTRKCAFCAVEKYNPELIDEDEPSKIAKTVNEIKFVLPNAKVEVLVPDFLGKTELIDIVLVSKPDIFSHNLETVPCLYDNVRKGADYKRSMKVLKHARDAGFKVKTGIMLGLDETERQLFDTIKDVKDTGIDILTIGQYLAPIKKHYSIVKEYRTEEFQKIRDFALSVGINQVVSGRYVRSSYLAEEYF